MFKRILLIAVVAAVFSAASFSTSTASAGSPFLGPCYGYDNALQGNYYGLYGLGKLPVPPYFAIHPPVYYSAPVARPYGYSPYALLPGQQPAEALVVTEPEVIINPHVEELPAQETTANKVTMQPKWILNPFVDQVSTAVAAE